MSTTIEINRKKLEDAAWAATHRDFKGTLDGVRNVMLYIPGKGTCMVTLAELTVPQLLERARVRAEDAKRLRELEQEFEAARNGGPRFHDDREYERRIKDARRLFKLAGIDPATGV